MRQRIFGMAALLAVAACSTQPDDEDLAGFVPPTVTSRADYARLLEVRFARLDTNYDGYLTADELGPKRAARLPERDTDGNGKLSHSEYIATALARFDREDTDHDGVLTNMERTAGQQPAR